MMLGHRGEEVEGEETSVDKYVNHHQCLSLLLIEDL